MNSFRLRATSACRFLPARRMSSSRRRKTAYALASWLMSLAEYWKGLPRTPASARAIRWAFSSAPESLDITKSAAPSISMPSAESAWTFGKTFGTMRPQANEGHGEPKQTPPAKLENESAISVGGFTKRSNPTAAGRSHTDIRSSSSDPGRAAKGRGDLSAIVCCTRTATTFMWRSRLCNGRRSMRSTSSNGSIPSFLLPRVAGEERGVGLHVLNRWNVLNQ